ncbi:hypothetical protein [Achromobacter sp. AGC39]
MNANIGRHLNSSATNPTTLVTVQNAVLVIVVGAVAVMTGQAVALLGLAFMSPAPVLSVDHYAITAGMEEPPEGSPRSIGFNAEI